MTVYVQDADLTIHLGDVRDVLPTLEAESVDCVATSPPFYALRDYQVDGQIGLEATPDEWADELVAVFRECRRVLRPQGTLWVECGDSYGSRPNGSHGGWDSSGTGKETSKRFGGTEGAHVTIEPGTKPKDLMGTPWLLAFALRADGWYLRQCIVWWKPNAMPESVRDRCTTAHSYVFLFSKQPRYWFDADAISEPAAGERWGDQTTPKHNGTDTASGWIPARSKEQFPGGDPDVVARPISLAESQAGLNGPSGSPTSPPGRGLGKNELLGKRTYDGFNGRWNERNENRDGPQSKNARSVWQIPTRGFPGAHFATWPETLAERILLAGCPEWVCGTCGKARERIVETAPGALNRIRDVGGRTDGYTQPRRPPGASDADMLTKRTTIGWSDCGHGNYRPGTVLDPFGGAGTTALVARRLGRRSVLVELNEEYARMAAERLSQLSLLAEGAV